MFRSSWGAGLTGVAGHKPRQTYLALLLLSFSVSAFASDSATQSELYFPVNQLSVSADAITLEGQSIATAGTIIPAGPGSEFPAIELDYDLDAVGGALSYARNLKRGLPRWLDRNASTSELSWGVTWSRFSASEHAAFNQAAGTDEVGYLLTQLAPAPDDVAGFNYGNIPIQSVADMEVDYAVGELFVAWLSELNLFDDAFWVSRLAAGYRSRDLEIVSRDRFEPDLPSSRFVNFRRQKIDEDTKQIGIGGRLINPIGTENRFDVFADLMARLYFVESELDSTEYVGNGPGPKPELRFNQDKDEVDVGLDVSVGGGWNISARWRLAAAAQAYFNVPTISIVNPVTFSASNPGTEPLPLSDLEYENETLWGLKLELSYRF